MFQAIASVARVRSTAPISASELASAHASESALDGSKTWTRIKFLTVVRFSSLVNSHLLWCSVWRKAVRKDKELGLYALLEMDAEGDNDPDAGFGDTTSTEDILLGWLIIFLYNLLVWCDCFQGAAVFSLQSLIEHLYLARLGYSSYQFLTVPNQIRTVPNRANSSGTGTTLLRKADLFNLALPLTNMPVLELNYKCANTLYHPIIVCVSLCPALAHICEIIGVDSLRILSHAYMSLAASSSISYIEIQNIINTNLPGCSFCWKWSINYVLVH